MTLGETIPEILDRRELWRFEGRAGNEVTIGVTAATKTADATLSLFDATGTLLTSVDDPEEGVRDPELSTFLPADGEYFVKVGWNGDAAPFALATSVQAPAPLALGDTVRAPAGGQPNWQFDGRAGDVVTFALTALEPDGDALLTLYDSDLVALSVSDNFDGLNPRISAILPETGPYLSLIHI